MGFELVGDPADQFPAGGDLVADLGKPRRKRRLPIVETSSR